MKYLRNEWDRAGAWLCVTAGAVALVVGYFGVSGTLETGKQLPYVVSGGKRRPTSALVSVRPTWCRLQR